MTDAPTVISVARLSKLADNVVCNVLKNPFSLDLPASCLRGSSCLGVTKADAVLEPLLDDVTQVGGDFAGSLTACDLEVLG